MKDAVDMKKGKGDKKGSQVIRRRGIHRAMAKCNPWKGEKNKKQKKQKFPPSPPTEHSLE